MSFFNETGFWPLNSSLVCANGLQSFHTNRILVSSTALNMDICRYFTEFKRHGLPALVVRSCFICMRTGIELTPDDVWSELCFIELDRARKRKDRKDLKERKESELCERRARIK